ncbi:undecaprenyldiphospho-muramoylpentapeptide beta-N-acetylglucosaminyltransferase [Prochlorococcus marinus]|uniref:UDP-N-acetylglucosamine--N-acetylmuramyl-(pentapeptide) pyrophosphoryl-undecaprenol N-acetylglucosamine transferase n=1 Tax=Prochlorococcus marinus XMU1408 TaxID=2213228 RepID=A0A318R7E6_PROMR|nr:undecaprenyldiphospho-muramoylpentapeptide beta-N-acetylglucosaminyltransferase [Prochlorococcus marinus]MBW3041258.1 undecaprenyldiphospho-muramoylpentapeptide beta-N-acetylglucosaminyltransferase [Prochlorococcus marinus str. XMU1408]PYE03847.1 undecaprenyldiphospho-muramoylpentapeptide beta-N-acetylglucosaminyltransferase [Prochlorococcus marinus XMU1408]
MPRLLIAASGTGGHIYPALSLAESISNSWEIVWLGVPNRLEIELVPKKYQLITLQVGGLQGSIFRKLVEFFKLLFASIQVAILLRQKKINVIFTTGGYISAPSILGAKLTGTPILLHESNAIPGKVTRLLGRFCDHLALGIPTTADYLAGCKTSFTGTPVRSEFFLDQPLPSWVPKGEGVLIVVMGGSQGAKKLNGMVRSLLPWLLEKGCRIVHLTGKNDCFYRNLGNIKAHTNFVFRNFSDEMPALLSNADLAISRAGAGAICELIITKTPSVLIPFPQSADQHQELNAAYMAQLGGAVIVHQHNPEEHILRNTISNLLDSNSLAEMKFNMNKNNFLKPEEKIIEIIKSIS